jgi:hypothetical protein
MVLVPFIFVAWMILPAALQNRIGHSFPDNTEQVEPITK